MSAAAEVVMYSTAWCGYCQRARNLFERKGVAVREIKVDDEPDERERCCSGPAAGAPCRRSSSASATSGVMMSWPRSTAPANWTNCSAWPP